MSYIIETVYKFWNITAEMAPYLLFGFIMAGVLHILLPRDFIARHLGKRGIIQTFKATILGVPMPLCSCGVIPVGASLYRQGAGRGATAAFLASTPQTGVDSIMATYGLLGPFFALVRVVVAFVTGIVAGIVVDRIPEKGNETALNRSEDSTQEKAKTSVSSIITYGFYTLPRDIGRSLVLGLIIAGILGAVIPEHFFSETIGSSPFAFLAITAVAIPLYVCSTGSIPIALALIHSGLSPGTALVFLIAGPATNAAAIGTIWNLLGKRSSGAYLATIIGLSWIAGWLFDGIVTGTGIGDFHADHSGHIQWWNHAGAAALIAILGHALIRQKSIKSSEKSLFSDTQERIVLRIDGMRCSHCAQSVTDSISSNANVHTAEVNLDRGLATITGTSLDRELLARGIENLGYTVRNE